MADVTSTVHEVPPVHGSSHVYKDQIIIEIDFIIHFGEEGGCINATAEAKQLRQTLHAKLSNTATELDSLKLPPIPSQIVIPADSEDILKLQGLPRERFKGKEV
ncbi:hypothetical protein VISI1226_05733 [Vibrio sinaloensis DSM 21326]|uniref:Uncharacterized protein n=1 Tax=Vibrio sinaloensis DSM 21326 TaxID=945550 RepID=E8M131_PHOS4|nr:hypothetical protein VISI1226_05733 [Vibrio sinaloensis DSM 21326]